jgi:hypothetical protein
MSPRVTDEQETVNLLPLRLSLAYQLSSPLAAAQVFLAPKLGFSTTC